MSPRVYTRRFDWDEARRLRATGMTWEALGEHFGVSDMAVYFACNDEARKRSHERVSAWQRDGLCPDCGAPATRQGGGREHRCKACSGIRMATSAREAELQCFTCRRWLPDDSFPSNKTNKYGRRGKHQQCRKCLTEVKRAYRARQKAAA